MKSDFVGCSTRQRRISLAEGEYRGKLCLSYRAR